MLDYLFIAAGLLLLTPLVYLAHKHRRQALAGALPRAAEIAAAHGWVSAGRLMSYENLTEKDAKAALAEACRLGILFRSEDGRYYAKSAPVNSKAPNP